MNHMEMEGFLDSSLEKEEDENGKPKRHPAYLRNLKVRTVSLVDDPAVPKAHYRFIKMRKGVVQKEVSGVSEAENPLITPSELNETEKVDLSGQLSQLMEVVHMMQDSIVEHSEALTSLSERMESFGSMSQEPISDGGGTEEVESPKVDPEPEKVEEPSTEVDQSEPIIDAEELESLMAMADDVAALYESGDISEEEFDDFNSKLSQFFSEVA